MNKKIVITLGFFLIPVGAILLNACAPVDETQAQELAMSDVSDNIATPMYYGIPNPTQYGHCRTFWDYDGNGWDGPEDPACHINAGPLRDLSLYNFPQGHNFLADQKIPPGGPGYGGGFRDRAQMTRWFRFLTEPDGGTAGFSAFGDGVNPLVSPIPAPLLNKVEQGTRAQGNNNNLSVRGLTNYYGIDPLFVPGAAGAEAPSAGKMPAYRASALEVKIPDLLNHVSNAEDFQGLSYKGGSQGAFHPKKLGNPDGVGEGKNRNVPPQ